MRAAATKPLLPPGSTRAKVYRVVASLAILSCTSAAFRLPLPDVEAWGNLARPFDDAIDEAAWAALGPAPHYSPWDPIRLGDYWGLDGTSRNLREQQAAELMHRGRTLHSMSGADSLGLYLQAIRVSPLYFAAYQEAVRILVLRGEVWRAHALAVQAIRLERDNSLLWLLLGETYMQRSDRKRAHLVFEHSLRLGQTSPGLIQTIAMLRAAEGQSAQAESLLHAQQLDARWIEPYGRAHTSRESGDMAAAGEALRLAAGLGNPPIDVLVELGNAEEALGNLEAAEAAFEQARHFSPQDRPSRRGLATIALERGDFPAATVGFTRLVVTDPDDFASRLGYARAVLGLAEEDRLAGPRGAPGSAADSLSRIAEEQFSICIDHGFQSLPARTARAVARLLQGNLSGAEADCLETLASVDRLQHVAVVRQIVARVADALALDGQTERADALRNRVQEALPPD